MHEKTMPGPDRGDDAATRVAEISALFVSIRQTLVQMMTALGMPDAQTPKAIISKLGELQTAHLKVLAAEEAFHAQQDAIGGYDAIDIDAIRAEIGGRLARIRATLDAGEVPDVAD